MDKYRRHRKRHREHEREIVRVRVVDVMPCLVWGTARMEAGKIDGNVRLVWNQSACADVAITAIRLVVVVSVCGTCIAIIQGRGDATCRRPS